jgi:hypothetical protein
VLEVNEDKEIEGKSLFLAIGCSRFIKASSSPPASNNSITSRSCKMNLSTCLMRHIHDIYLVALDSNLTISYVQI